MSIILQVDFPYTGPWGEQMHEAMIELAQSIAEEPGLTWKIWTENKDRNEAGGIYYFTDEPSAQAYLTMHTERLKSFGIEPVNAKVSTVNKPLSVIDGAPIE